MDKYSENPQITIQNCPAGTQDAYFYCTEVQSECWGESGQHLPLNPKLKERYSSSKWKIIVELCSDCEFKTHELSPFPWLSQAIKQSKYLQGSKKNILLVNITFIFLPKILLFFFPTCHISDIYIIFAPHFFENLTLSTILCLTSGEW